MPVKSNELEKLQRTDHDTLIRLEAKLDGLVNDVKEMKDGTTKTLADHERRISKIEQIVTTTKLVESLRELKTLKQEWRDFNTTLKVYRLISGTVGGVLGAALVLLSQVLLRMWGFL